MQKNELIIIGGGASGLLAAISARRLGARVTILERNPRIGKKILATGNGRCNYTNIDTDLSCYSGHHPDFAASALSQFTVEDTLNFFERLGISPKIENEGKVFPMSEQASSFLDVFLYALNELDINLVCEALVKNIRPEKRKFLITLESGDLYKADKVIIATGGRAMPASGSDGSGYDLAEKLGHSITEIFPALVQLMLEGPYFKHLAGVKLLGRAEIIHNNQVVAQDKGDILFANYGVSGPPILQISRVAGALLQEGHNPQLKISVIDTMSQEKLTELMEKRWRFSPEKPIDFSLVGLVNKRLISVLLKEAGITYKGRLVQDLTKQEKERIVNILTDLKFKIRGSKSWPSAQVTAGGIDTTEINPDTMESKLIPGLYFAGEVIDIDGLCGGFNLQWAWSSGFVAGQNAAF